MCEEIGGEFWDIPLANKNSEFQSYKCKYKHAYLLSGRTALDFIIKDIKAVRPFNNVYMPSYCCETMIQSFLDNGINIEFYDVDIDNGRYIYDIDFGIRCDAVLIMQYFGYCNKTVGQIAKSFSESGKIIIEDATHSWFSEIPYSYESNYVFVSFRKWIGIPCGAIIIKHGVGFVASIPDITNYKYINMRIQAALFKKQYIEKNEGEKKTFLELFNQAEELLDVDYHLYGIPKEYEDIIARLDVEEIKKNRQLNATFLTEELAGFNGIEGIAMVDGDTPLFVPIIVHKGKRDKLWQYLIDNNIYCPVHWPIPDVHGVSNFNLYKNSLSLVCDQRYDLSDMKKIIKCIDDFYRKGA